MIMSTHNRKQIQMTIYDDVVMHDVVILVKFGFDEDDIDYPQVFSEEFLCKLAE